MTRRTNYIHLCRTCLSSLLAIAWCVETSLASGVLAQGRGAPQIRVGVNLVLVDATVRNASGAPIDGLTKEDFVIRDNGVQQKVDYFGRDELPLSITLVLDLSTSIRPFIDSLRDAASVTLATFKADDQVALFTFASDVDLRLQLTKDKAKISNELSGLSAGGSTNIKEALFQAASYLLVVKPKGRRVILLISDDVGTESGQHSAHDVVNEILEADASFYNLKVSGENPHHLNSDLDVTKVAKDTGGEVLEAKGVNALEPTFRALIQKIRNRYTLGYYVTASGADDKEHKVDVGLSPQFGARGKGYSVLAKRGYFFIRGAPAVDGYRQIGQQNTWTGAVTSTNDAERTIILSCVHDKKTETFTGTLPEGYKVKMSDGTIQDLKPSELAPGRRITLYYTRTTETYFGRNTQLNQIFWIDFAH